GDDLLDDLAVDRVAPEIGSSDRIVDRPDARVEQRLVEARVAEDVLGRLLKATHQATDDALTEERLAGRLRSGDEERVTLLRVAGCGVRVEVRQPREEHWELLILEQAVEVRREPW